MKLAEIVEDHKVNILKALCRRLGIAEGVSRKDDLTKALKKHVRRHLDEVVADLTDVQRLFLAEAAHHGGKFDARLFTAKHRVPAPRPHSWYRASDAQTIGLLIGTEVYSNEVFLAEELVEPLRNRFPRPAAASVTVTEEIPDAYSPPTGDWPGRMADRPVHVYKSERAFFAELRRVLTLVQTGKLAVADKSRRPTEAATRRLADALVVPDFDCELPEAEREKWTLIAGPIRAHAWAVLVQQCGWCKARDGALVVTPAGRKLLAERAPEALAEGFHRFLGDGQFDELNRISHIRGQSGKTKRYLSAPGERRKRIAASLAQWPVGAWVEFVEAYRFVTASGNDFDVIDDPMRLFIAEHRYGDLGGDYEGLERQYLRALLMESLATLGVVDLAYVSPHHLWPEFSGNWGAEDLDFCGRYDGLLYVRLTPLGAFLLGASEDYQLAAEAPRRLWKVLANHEVAVHSGTLPPADRATLDLVGVQTGDHLWKLDRQRILDYIERGGDVTEVTRLLAEGSDEPLPPTVETFLADLARQLGAVRSVEKAVLIEMADAETAARVAHASATKGLCHLAGKRHLAVPEKRMVRFRTAMKKLGYVVPQ